MALTSPFLRRLRPFPRKTPIHPFLYNSLSPSFPKSVLAEMYPFIYFCQFVYEKDAHSPFFAKVELSIFASESRDLAVFCPAFSVPCWGGGRVQGALSISQMCRVIREREVWTKGWIRKWEDKLWTRSEARDLVSGITKLGEWGIREIKQVLKPWGSHLPPSVFPLLLPLFLLNFICSPLLLDMFFGLILIS